MAIFHNGNKKMLIRPPTILVVIQNNSLLIQKWRSNWQSVYTSHVFCNLCLRLEGSSARTHTQMGIFSGTPPPSCPSSPRCAQWAQTYLKYCLCSTKDGVALGLGLASVISWGVAEVPQIITNYKQKSTEGLSIAFLMTWIVGYEVWHFPCSFFITITSWLYWQMNIMCDALSDVLCYSSVHAGICLTLLAASSNLLL